MVTDRHTHTHTDGRNDYCNPAAHVPRVIIMSTDEVTEKGNDVCGIILFVNNY